MCRSAENMYRYRKTPRCETLRCENRLKMFRSNKGERKRTKRKRIHSRNKSVYEFKRIIIFLRRFIPFFLLFGYFSFIVTHCV